MRGRLGSGVLRRLGLPELVALDRAQYVDLAVKLASSEVYRSEIREKMRRAEATAYSDIGAVDALSAVLLESA